MNALRALSIVLAVAAVAAMTFGTVGFSAVAAERGVSVTVVDDDSAFVDFSACQVAEADNQGEPVNITVENRFADQLEVLTVNDEKPPQESKRFVDPGEQTEFTVALDPNATTATLKATTSGSSIVIEREIDSCGSADESSTSDQE